MYALTAIVVHSQNYSETSVMVGRVACVVAFLALVIQFAVRPLLPKIRDERAALYLEEHEPSLDGAIFTSIEVDNALKAGADQISPALAGRLKSNALERARTISGGRRVDAMGLRTSWALIAGVVALATMLINFGPAPLRNGLRLLAMPWTPPEASTIFSIAVDPGNMKVAKGGDAEVGARLRNFQSEEVVVLARTADSASWSRLPMIADSTGHYTARILDISVPHRRREPAVREERELRVPLSDLHRDALGEVRFDGRHRGAEGHAGHPQGRDDDAGGRRPGRARQRREDQARPE